MNMLMSEEEFHRIQPEFCYRLGIKKDFYAEIPTGVEVCNWMRKTFGEKGNRWLPKSGPGTVRIWFKNEEDLAWAKLRWA